MPARPRAELLQRPAPRDVLRQALGQFIEFVVHNFPFVVRVQQVAGARGARNHLASRVNDGPASLQLEA